MNSRRHGTGWSVRACEPREKEDKGDGDIEPTGGSACELKEAGRDDGAGCLSSLRT